MDFIAGVNLEQIHFNAIFSTNIRNGNNSLFLGAVKSLPTKNHTFPTFTTSLEEK